MVHFEIILNFFTLKPKNVFFKVCSKVDKNYFFPGRKKTEKKTSGKNTLKKLPTLDDNYLTMNRIKQFWEFPYAKLGHFLELYY